MMPYAVIFLLLTALNYSIVPEFVVPTCWLLVILLGLLILIDLIKPLIVYVTTVVAVAMIIGELLYIYAGFVPNLFELLFLAVGFVFIAQFGYSLYLFVTSTAGQNFILYVAFPASLVFACDWVWRSVVPWLTVANLYTLGNIIYYGTQFCCYVFVQVVELLIRIIQYPDSLPALFESLFGGDVAEEWFYIVGGLLVLQWLILVLLWLLDVRQLYLQVKTWWDKRH